MRAHELVSLDVNHVRFSRPYHVRILGKGRKERTCPLGRKQSKPSRPTGCACGKPDEASPFRQRGGKPAERFGLRHIITHRVAEAAKVCLSLFTRKVTPTPGVTPQRCTCFSRMWI
jgi:site-specific recombinase XerC